MSKQTYKFSDLKRALNHDAPADEVNDIVAHLSSADINKAVKTFNPGVENTLVRVLTPDMLQKVAGALDASTAAKLANLPPEPLAFNNPIYNDTAAFDHFAGAVGAFQATDINQNTLTYGITGSTATSLTLDGVTYDHAAASDFGVLLLNSASGAYHFIADDTAINALTTTTTATFNITVSDGTNLPVSKAFNITLNGVSDAPVVSGPVTGQATEHGDPVALDALANATDVDDSDQANLSVVLPDQLPTGVSYDANTHSFILDPTNPVFAPLNNGDQTTVTVNYSVTDGNGGTTAASASWTVNGVTDAPPPSVVHVGVSAYDDVIEVNGTDGKDYFVVDATKGSIYRDGIEYSNVSINGFDSSQDVLVFENASLPPDAITSYDDIFNSYSVYDDLGAMLYVSALGETWAEWSDLGHIIHVQIGYQGHPSTVHNAQDFFEHNVQIVGGDFQLPSETLFAV